MHYLEKPVVVVVPGDLHLTEPGLDNVRVAHRVIDDVNTLIRPDFVQFIGDNVQDATEKQFQLFNQIRGHIVSGPDQVTARIWSAASVRAARYSIDDGPWTGLQLSDDGHCHGQLPSNNLAKGIHRLEVVAVTTDGTEGSQRIEFMVDPTGRYTAVPEVSPMVTSTAFC